MIRPGDRIVGRFRIERELGRSEEGHRFEAIIERTGQPVVIAVADALDSPRARARWAVDAALAERLDGRHVVRVFESGTLEDGTPWMAHEPILGTLADELRTTGALPIPEAVGRTLEACEALAEAHAIGIAHGDLRPSSVALARDVRGRVVAKVAWTGAGPSDHLDRAAVLGDIAGLARLFRTLVSGGAPDEESPTLPSDLAHTIARATSGTPEPFANVAELARALGRHAGPSSAAALARRAALPFSRAGVVGPPVPLGATERSSAAPSRPSRTLTFLVVALTLLGVAIGGTFAMARSGAARRWTGTAPDLVATTTLTSAESGTTREAEEVTTHAVDEWSLAKPPPHPVARPAPPPKDFPETSIDEVEGESDDTESE